MLQSRLISVNYFERFLEENPKDLWAMSFKGLALVLSENEKDGIEFLKSTPQELY